MLRLLRPLLVVAVADTCDLLRCTSTKPSVRVAVADRNRQRAVCGVEQRPAGLMWSMLQTLAAARMPCYPLGHIR